MHKPFEPEMSGDPMDDAELIQAEERTTHEQKVEYWLRAIAWSISDLEKAVRETATERSND